MIRKTLLVMVVLIGLILSGCTEHDVQTDNNTADACVNATNTATNASEHVSSQSVSIPLEKPRFIENQ